MVPLKPSELQAEGDIINCEKFPWPGRVTSIYIFHACKTVAVRPQGYDLIIRVINRRLPIQYLQHRDRDDRHCCPTTPPQCPQSRRRRLLRSSLYIPLSNPPNTQTPPPSPSSQPTSPPKPPSQSTPSLPARIYPSS